MTSLPCHRVPLWNSFPSEPRRAHPHRHPPTPSYFHRLFTKTPALARTVDHQPHQFIPQVISPNLPNPVHSMTPYFHSNIIVTFVPHIGSLQIAPSGILADC
ncbi:hypothetical protein GALMADRAFT_730716 [Galerina marginata CBS 339.88]|uniref:Uncharacterized protein n=1 Tax=Galerina marginata (strain CBS 339.88) TaxID=685588 RepID=A0A067T084_GALM3|nr:hypothetical protein GALMADRAFT_730716 [Galerina marginata CBS 339.88]